MASACWICRKPLGIEELPFKCSYCGGTFCAEHRLPPNHSCLHVSAWRMGTPLHTPTKKGLLLAYQKGAQAQVETRKPRRRWVKWAAILIILAIAGGAYFTLPKLGIPMPALPITLSLPQSTAPIQTTVGNIVQNPGAYIGKNVTVEGHGVEVCMLMDDQGYQIKLQPPLPYEKERAYAWFHQYRVVGEVVKVEGVLMIKPLEIEVIKEYYYQ